jgi:hypothetical protein
MNTLEYQSINLLVPSLLYQSIALPDSFCMQWSITGVRDSSSNSLYWANCFLFFFFCNKSNLINNRSYPKPGPMGEGPHDLIHNRELTRLQQELDYCKKKEVLKQPIVVFAIPTCSCPSFVFRGRQNSERLEREIGNLESTVLKVVGAHSTTVHVSKRVMARRRFRSSNI